MHITGDGSAVRRNRLEKSFALYFTRLPSGSNGGDFCQFWVMLVIFNIIKCVEFVDGVSRVSDLRRVSFGLSHVKKTNRTHNCASTS